MKIETPGGRRVLIADDNPGVLKSVARLLAFDYDVVGCVSNGRAVIEAAEQLQPDIIVLDLSFTDIESLEVCRLVTRQHPQIKVVVFTVDDGPAMRQQAFEAGAVAFVSKLASDDLLSELNNLRDNEH